MQDTFHNIEGIEEILNKWHPYMHAVAYMNDLINYSLQYK